MARDWTVEDYWNWNPAFTAGLANFQRTEDRKLREAEGVADRDMRREELGFRRQIESRIAGVQERQQTRLEAADLNDMTEKIAAGLGYQGYDPHETELKNPAFQAGFMTGRAKRMADQEREQQRLDLLVEQIQGRLEVEKEKARLRGEQPTRFDFDTEIIRDAMFNEVGRRFVPRGTIGTQTNPPPAITGIPEALGSGATNRFMMNPKTGKFERVQNR